MVVVASRGKELPQSRDLKVDTERERERERERETFVFEGLSEEAGSLFVSPRPRKRKGRE